jgi:hypothetical protein
MYPAKHQRRLTGGPGGFSTGALFVVAALALSACGELVGDAGPGLTAPPTSTTDPTDSTQVTLPPVSVTGTTEPTNTDSTIPPSSGIYPPAVPPTDLGEDPALDALADLCFVGDIVSCDQLFAESPIDSPYEEFADTCGGRNEAGFICVDLYAAVQPVPLGTWLGVLGWTESAATAIDQADQAFEFGALDARVLSTNQYDSLTPGLWLVYVAPSVSSLETAAACDDVFNQVGLPCYQALATGDPLLAASGPAFGAWTVILASLSEGTDDAYKIAVDIAVDVFPASVELAPQFGSVNPSTGVLLSTDYPSLTAGFWVPYAAQFDTEAQARAFCTELVASGGVSDCAARPLAAWGER